jgi:hypothetical protein
MGASTWLPGGTRKTLMVTSAGLAQPWLFLSTLEETTLLQPFECSNAAGLTFFAPFQTCLQHNERATLANLPWHPRSQICPGIHSRDLSLLWNAQPR